MTTTSHDDRVLFDVDADNRIATITLNNPERRNSYDAAMREAVARCLDQVAEDDDITVVLLRGVDGVFSTGADMNNAYGWYGEKDDGKKSRPSQRRRLTVDRKSFGFYHNLMGFPKVTVGEISGYALGGGFELVLACDLVVASDRSVFGLPEVRLGLVPGAGGVFRLFRQLPQKVAMGYLLTGRRLDAATAYAHGLINEVVPAGRLDECVDGWVGDLVASAPLSVRAIKEAALRSVDLPLPGAFTARYRWEERRRRGADAIEGPRAFAERREPIWSGN
jgi:crotonobetainyl-CoA hydratase/dehydration protein DpgD